jgi:hypothetical protein
MSSISNRMALEEHEQDADVFKYGRILELSFLPQNKATQLFKTCVVVLLSKLQIRGRCKKMR